ncbi:hypothetical protein BDZ89DRAFT_552903 [Hymenopellis radicata]|nr:hypothetical protein BDZ89DRAFT_552903 [Hymenopellis radicata]
MVYVVDCVYRSFPPSTRFLPLFNSDKADNDAAEAWRSGYKRKRMSLLPSRLCTPVCLKKERREDDGRRRGPAIAALFHLHTSRLYSCFPSCDFALILHLDVHCGGGRVLSWTFGLLHGRGRDWDLDVDVYGDLGASSRGWPSRAHSANQFLGLLPRPSSSHFFLGVLTLDMHMSPRHLL